MSVFKYIFIVFISYTIATFLAIGPSPLNHLLFSLSFFGCVYLFYKKDITFQKPKLDKKDGLMVVIGVLILLLLDVLLIYILPTPLEEQHTKTMIQSYGLFGVFLACIVAPFVEEFIFRYTPQNDKATIITSIIMFGLMHAQISKDLYTSLYPAIVTMINGVIFYIFYKKTNNLYVSILIHAVSNFIALGL